ncbi:MAG: phosphodiester glycosidase family protein [Deltaproteobacteria bacterium]|nr:phosphodiester glycosidase family protein [Deltaproteobacteria bacterium]
MTEIYAYPVRLRSSPGLSVTEVGTWKTIQKGAEFRKVSLERAEPYHLIDMKVLRFDSRWVSPRIVRSQQHQMKGSNVRSLAEKAGAIAMINANYFDEKGRPLGFLKTGTEEINAQISKSSLFTGIFGIKDRLPFIVHRDQFSSNQADEALQAGPLLILKSVALNVTRGAGKQNRRTLIGLDKEQRLVIAVTDSLVGGLSWVELQEFFSAPEWPVRLIDLLNLDGGGSAQLYVRGAQLEDHVLGTTEVPVAVGFFPRGN